jgi:hypothetical protein
MMLAPPSVCVSSLPHTSTLRLRGGMHVKTCNSFSSLTNTVIFADTNLIINYPLNAALKANVDDQKERGLKFYVTQAVSKEFFSSSTVTLPAGFQLCQSPQDFQFSEKILSELVAVLNLEEGGVKKFGNDLTILVEACYSAKISLLGPYEIQRNFVFATGNMKFLRRCLGDKEKRSKVRSVLERYGLNLIPVISVTGDTVKNYY